MGERERKRGRESETDRQKKDWLYIQSPIVCVLSCVRLFAAPWTVACQAPLCLEFSRQKYQSALPLPPPGNLPDPGIKPASPESPDSYKILAIFPMLYNISSQLIFVLNSLYLLIPYPFIAPLSSLSPLVTTGLFSTCVDSFLFCYIPWIVAFLRFHI